MRALFAYGLAVALGVPLAASLQSCASSKGAERDPLVAGPSVRVYECSEGVASYYSNHFHGRKTASGERYDRKRLTAAHASYPFGTCLRVTSLDNGASVVVRVNDRGPRGGRRALDLSYAAASQLDMLRAGIANVRLEVIDWGDARSDEGATPTSGKSVGEAGR